jgi:hypothetical protein
VTRRREGYREVIGHIAKGEAIMRILARISIIAAAFALVTGIVGPASAGPTSTNYSGTFAGQITYQGCKGGNPGVHIASGTWRVNVATNGDASARFVIYVDGAPHVAFTAPMQADTLQPGEVFADTLMTGAGPLRVSLVGTTFEYRIAPYDYTPWGGEKCQAVTYWGVLS